VPPAARPGRLKRLKQPWSLITSVAKCPSRRLPDRSFNSASFGKRPDRFLPAFKRNTKRSLLHISPRVLAALDASITASSVLSRSASKFAKTSGIEDKCLESLWNKIFHNIPYANHGQMDAGKACAHLIAVNVHGNGACAVPETPPRPPCDRRSSRRAQTDRCPCGW
jgi:hypothetical protein